MKLFTKRDKRTQLDKEIEAILEYIKPINPDTEEYTTTIENLIKLIEARDNKKSMRKVSPDTIALIAGGLLEIGLIMGYERLSVITTKAWGRVLRGRV